MPTINELEAILQKEPDDVFLNFGLSMALAAAGRPQEALERFERTLALDPDYVPAHFQKGRLLADVGRTEDAREALEHGIEVARKVGDEHAKGEMGEFLVMLEA